MHRIATVLVATLLVGCASDGGTGPEPITYPELTITTADLPDAVVGEAYGAGIDAEGGDGAYTWTVLENGLPVGLALSVEDLADNDMLITGTPEAAGTSRFVLQVESGDGQVVTREFSITVLEEGVLGFETRILPPALAGGPYDVGLVAMGTSGPPFTFSIVGGALPDGLTMTGGGRISGTPTTVDTAHFTVRLESSGITVEQAFRIPVVPNRPAGFQITAFPVVPVPASIQPHLDAAIARWHDAITGDLNPVAIEPDFFDSDACGGFSSALNGTSTDDVIILVHITSIDGPGQVLGQAGPCGIRGNLLPFGGVLTLDADDLDALVGTETLTDLIAHEIAHVLGYGALWELAELVTGVGGSDPRYVGTSAIAQYAALGGAGTIPVENQGGQGTAGSHWREVTFDREVLTGFAEPPGVDQPLSRMSIASFEDLGYAVDLTAADVFTVASAQRAASRGAALAGIGHDEVLGGTVRILYEDGSSAIVTIDGVSREAERP